MPSYTLKHKDGTTSVSVPTTTVVPTRGDLTVNINNAVYELETRDGSGNHTYRYAREEGQKKG